MNSTAFVANQMLVLRGRRAAGAGGGGYGEEGEGRKGAVSEICKRWCEAGAVGIGAGAIVDGGGGEKPSSFEYGADVGDVGGRRCANGYEVEEARVEGKERQLGEETGNGGGCHVGMCVRRGGCHVGMVSVAIIGGTPGKGRNGGQGPCSHGGGRYRMFHGRGGGERSRGGSQKGRDVGHYLGEDRH